jgi:hypothetical protein
MWLEGKWMQLEDIILSEVRQVRKTKATCFLSHVGDRHNTNTSNIMINSYAKEMSLMGERG